MKIFSQLSLVILLLDSSFTRRHHYVDARLRISKNKWVQLSSDLAFQRNPDLPPLEITAMNRATDDAIHRMLLSSSASAVNPAYFSQSEDSSETYDAYQLAWHLLGYYLDCNSESNYGSGCTRQVLYAVYVNPKYEGGGIGEYTYYDTTSGTWECHGQGSKCITKMDCHLEDTQWKLLGVFKIDDISQRDGWMEQLFKHQGVCIWGEDTYDFASNMRQKMPSFCTPANQLDENGNALFYDTKPKKNGEITLGLYSDDRCSREYAGNETYDVFQIADSDESYWESFNEALDVYKQCQPCISYDLSEDDFTCSDKAGYTNCNQCMKFSNKAGCKVASESDIILAARQQGLVSFDLNGVTYKTVGLSQSSHVISSYSIQNDAGGYTKKSEFFSLLSISALFCLLGLSVFLFTTKKKSCCKSKSRKKKRRWGLRGYTKGRLDEDSLLDKSKPKEPSASKISSPASDHKPREKKKVTERFLPNKSDSTNTKSASMEIGQHGSSIDVISISTDIVSTAAVAMNNILTPDNAPHQAIRNRSDLASTKSTSEDGPGMSVDILSMSTDMVSNAASAINKMLAPVDTPHQDVLNRSDIAPTESASVENAPRMSINLVSMSADMVSHAASAMNNMLAPVDAPHQDNLNRTRLGMSHGISTVPSQELKSVKKGSDLDTSVTAIISPQNIINDLENFLSLSSPGGKNGNEISSAARTKGVKTVKTKPKTSISPPADSWWQKNIDTSVPEEPSSKHKGESRRMKSEKKTLVDLDYAMSVQEQSPQKSLGVSFLEMSKVNVIDDFMTGLKASQQQLADAVNQTFLQSNEQTSSPASGRRKSPRRNIFKSMFKRKK